jgi:ABC-type branched-subunit amino acid transport system permease subunit
MVNFSQWLRLFARVNGPQTFGSSSMFWSGVVCLIAVGTMLPYLLSGYELVNLTGFVLMLFLAMGLCFIWGFCGILSLGQGAFFGLGGYAYGVVGINFIESQDNTNIAFITGLLTPVLLAALLGYFMFYARLRGVFVAILLLVVTLLFQTFLNQTAGAQWHIGKAYLGGNNGLGRFSAGVTELPSIKFGVGEFAYEFVGTSPAFYYFVFGLAVLTFLGLRIVVNSRIGYTMVAIREDPDRTEAFGYDVRLIQLLVFCVGALLAALSGVLYVSWGGFIDPSAFGLYNNILPVIWVAVGGRKSLEATVVSTLFLLWLSQRLAIGGQYSFIVLGTLLVAVMMLTPEGVLTSVLDYLARRRRPPITGASGALTNSSDSKV